VPAGDADVRAAWRAFAGIDVGAADQEVEVHVCATSTTP
jgi:hypothetical protein